MFSKMKTNFKKSVGYGKYSSLSKINRQWRKWRTRAKSLELKLSCGNDHVVKNSIHSNGDLDLWSNDPKINRVLPLPKGNHVAKFGKDPIYRTKVIVRKPMWTPAIPSVVCKFDIWDSSLVVFFKSSRGITSPCAETRNLCVIKVILLACFSTYIFFYHYFLSFPRNKKYLVFFCTIRI